MVVSELMIQSFNGVETNVNGYYLEMNKLISGVWVKPIHRGPNVRMECVEQVNNGGDAKTTTFGTESGPITVFDYFLQKYNIPLQ